MDRVLRFATFRGSRRAENGGTGARREKLSCIRLYVAKLPVRGRNESVVVVVGVSTVIAAADCGVMHTVRANEGEGGLSDMDAGGHGTCGPRRISHCYLSWASGCQGAKIHIMRLEYARGVRWVARIVGSARVGVADASASAYLVGGRGLAQWQSECGRAGMGWRGD